jgi:hypothetical protein
VAAFRRSTPQPADAPLHASRVAIQLYRRTWVRMARYALGWRRHGNGRTGPSRG